MSPDRYRSLALALGLLLLLALTLAAAYFLLVRPDGLPYPWQVAVPPAHLPT